jgi:Asp-tRNA(Asn)/Glu-tRNA(Gln) amidotransferase B subunit
MASLPSPESRDVQEMVHHLKWSHTEKQIARKAFELALDREFRSVIRRAKDMAGQIEQPTDLWDLEHYLTESRKRIDRTYDYRYSVLTDVFGRLVREGRLSEDKLQGLGEDKLQSIRSYARLLAKLDEEARNLEAHE